jgi:hypothetical protein
MSRHLIAKFRSFRPAMTGGARRGPTRLTLAATGVAGALAVTGLGTLAASAATPVQSTSHAVTHAGSTSALYPHGIVPHYGAYLGADPDPSPGVATATQAAALEKLTHRALGLVSFYVSFTAQPSLSQLDEVAAQGSIPFVSMKCGSSDQNIASGQFDKQLIRDAQEYKTYGGPVLFRWFWEMNLPVASNHAPCLGPNAAMAPHWYIAAYQHIWNVFHQQGALNVYFVWCPSAAQHAANSESTVWYPGSQYVDWIGGDLYDRNLIVPKSFQQQFAPFYSYWTTHAPGKPLILGETGSVDSANHRQAKWLQGIAAAVPHFPALKAVVYVDAVDQGDYRLTGGPGGGLGEFAAMAQSPYFSEFAPHDGYVFATSGGGVFTYETQYLGSESGKTLPAPIVGVAYDRAGTGYWLVGADGSVYNFGAAKNYGSMRGHPLRRPIVGMAALPNGTGYWLVASDGGIFSFGAAHFHGSMGGKHLNKPIVGMTADPVGNGYWFVASDGGIFTFGGARFFGSTGSIKLNKPINGMCSTPDARGYWLVASDGGIFAFGDARFKGSLGSDKHKVHVVGMSTDDLTGGYRLITLKGAVYQFPGPIMFKAPALESPVVAMDSTGVQ